MTDLSTLLGMRTKSSTIFHISKAYKFLGRKWQGNHHNHNRKKNSLNDKDEALNGGGKKDNSNRNTSGGDDDGELTFEGSLLLSRDNKTSDDKFLFIQSLSRSSIRRSHTLTLSSMLSRSMSRDQSQSRGRFGVLSRNKSSRRSVSMSRQSMYVDEGRPASIKRSVSSMIGSKNVTPIVFSHTATRKKAPPIESTLEELCFGSVKYVILKKDVSSETGVIQEEESLKINIKPGLKKGTKITFEGKGDENPGHLPTDIIFLIEERRHPLFKTRGDDLEIGVEIPLVQALTGCTLSVPLLGGEKMNLYIDEVIFSGYEKAISGQGMPDPKGNGKRGELRIAFFIKFPSYLSD